MRSAKSAVTIDDINDYMKYFGITPKMNKVVPEEESQNSLGSKGNAEGNPRLSARVASNISQKFTGSPKSANVVDVEHREKLDLSKISDDRKEYLSSVRPLHSKGLSGWTSKGFFGMEAVVEPEVFFISKAGDSFHEVYDREMDLGDAKYEIFSESHTLFYAVETLQGFDTYPFRIKDIEVIVTGTQGGIVFQISGSNKFAEVKDGENEPLGTITRYGVGPYLRPSYKHWSYRIRDAEGVEVCRIKRPITKDNYDIYVPGTSESVGVIMENSDSGPEAGNTLGLVLHESHAIKFDPTQKALILAGVMVIFNNYMGPTDNFGPNKRRFRFGLLYNICIAAIIMILGFVVIVVTIHSANTPGKKAICPKYKQIH